MNASYQQSIIFFTQQVQASQLQIDHLLGAWLRQPDALESPRHLCVLLSHARSLCHLPHQDPDRKKVLAILAAYTPHEQRALSERRIDQVLIRGMQLRLSLPDAWQGYLTHGNDDVARQILEIAAKSARKPEIPDIWQSRDRRTPSIGVFNYLMMLINIGQYFNWPQAMNQVEKHIAAVLCDQSYEKTCTQHRWIGLFSVMGDSWQSKAEDIAYENLYRPGYLANTLKHDANSFFRTLLLFLETNQNQGILRFLAYLSLQQVSQSIQTRRFTIRFSPEELDDWLVELLNQQKLLALLERVKASHLQPQPGFKLDSQHLAELLQAEILGPFQAEYRHVAWSFKEVGAGGLFIASDNNWSAHYNSRRNPIQRAFGSGVRTVIANREELTETDRVAGGSFLLVDNTYAALIKLAVAQRASFNGQLVAITGSVGKSSTAEMLYHTSLGLRRSYKNTPHFNHQTGVPISLVNIPDGCEFAVIEMGMGDVSTILPKAILARPHVAIITEIQEDHMEFHPSAESIVYTKMEIIEGLEPGGWLILNRDSPYFPLMLGIARSRGIDNLMTFGQHPLADICLQQAALHADHSILRVRIDQQCFAYCLALPGIHMAINSLAVIATHRALGWQLQETLPHFESVQPVESRNQRLQVRLRDGRELVLIDDSFNINPASIVASIHSLSLSEPGTGGRRIMVTGDIGEMGEGTEDYHERIAPVINRSNIDIFYSIGNYTKLIHQKLKEDIVHRHFESPNDLVDELSAELRHGDVVAVKGSARDATINHIISGIKRA